LRELIGYLKLKPDELILHVGGGTGTLAVDFEKPHNPFIWIISIFMNGFENTRENIKGLIPKKLRNSGFSVIKDLGRKNSIISSTTILEVTI